MGEPLDLSPGWLEREVRNGLANQRRRTPPARAVQEGDVTVAFSSTGTMVLKAMQEDPEIVALIQRVGRKYPQEQASSLVQGVIEKTLSTSTLTAEYGQDRPTGIEFFKLELNRLAE
jgi:hypothetical protein